MTNPIGALFGRSPIKPIEGHMDKAHEAVVLTGDLLEASCARNWVKAEALNEQIDTLEKDADEIKRDIRSRLPNSLFLPFARSDLLELLHIQDRIADTAKKVGRVILSRKLEIPGTVAPHFQAFYKANLESTTQARKAIHELDELLETGFRGREVVLVTSLVRQLDDTEENCEDRELELRTRLFELEDSMPPIEVMFLYRLIDEIGKIQGAAHRIGGHLLLLIAK